MPRFAAIFVLTILPLLSHAAEKPTALKAMKALPKGEEKNLARIEAHGGAPVPERWHFLVYNSEAEAGLKEYVVANGELITTREISQFADSLTAADVIGSKAVHVDSDKLAKIAQDYAAANDVTIASITYQLFKDGKEAQPAWRVICYDQSEQMVGTLVVTAAKGKAVSHEGFPTEPKAGKHAKAKLQFRTEAQPMVAVVDESEAEGIDAGDDRTQAVEPEVIGELAPAEARDESESEGRAYIQKPGTSEKKSEATSSRSQPKRTVRQRSIIRPPNPISVARGVTRPVRHIVRRLLPF